MAVKTGTKLLGTVVVAGLVIAFGQHLSKHENLGIQKPETKTSASPKIIRLAAMWIPPRQMSVTYWIDGVKQPNPDLKSYDPFWEETFNGVTGQIYKMQVEQHGLGGYLQCEITQNGKLAAAENVKESAGECVLEHRVY